MPRTKTAHNQVALGGGTANEVFKAEYKTGFGGRKRKTAFYKPTRTYEEKLAAFEGRDIDAQSQRSALKAVQPEAKSVASSQVDKLLGFNLLARERFSQNVNSQGEIERGTLSTGVKGQSTQNALFEQKVDETDAQVQQHMFNNPSQYKHKNGELFRYTGTQFVTFDYSNPTTQKQLSDLQLLDMITNQGDRHGGNIFIDAKGRVSGIDNDQAFGVLNALDRGQSERELGMPEQIDAGTAKRLLAIKPKDFVKNLTASMASRDKNQQLDEKKLKSLQKRFELVQDHLRQEKAAGRLIKKWDQSTYQDQFAKTNQTDDLPTGYLARATKHINEAATGQSETQDELITPGGTLYRRIPQKGPTPAPQIPAPTPTLTAAPKVAQTPAPLVAPVLMDAAPTLTAAPKVAPMGTPEPLVAPTARTFVPRGRQMRRPLRAIVKCCGFDNEE